MPAPVWRRRICADAASSGLAVALLQLRSCVLAPLDPALASPNTFILKPASGGESARGDGRRLRLQWGLHDAGLRYPPGRVITRDIRSSDVHTACDVCGRTMLRGEEAEVYVSGAARRSVCELCKPRAVEEGWIPEGTVPPYAGRDAVQDRRGSLFSRLRRRRDGDFAEGSGSAIIDSRGEESQQRRRRRATMSREPRHVRAVPTSVEQKIVSAVELFNSSEHPRTVAGVGRSLGEPTISVRPGHRRASVVNLVVSWELCWYRYEVDLADEPPIVRVAEQGAELDELEHEELQRNAVCDEHGVLDLQA